jgi:glycosyltransferase involved in cell wall biosynthesis
LCRLQKDWLIYYTNKKIHTKELMLPIVSVILPVYNQENFLEETIESILSQHFQQFELLIADDGSTDNSAEIINKYAAKDSRIRAFFEKNTGKSETTNGLVAKAKGQWCAFLDADDVMLPNRLKTQLDFHIANLSVMASSCNCYYINREGNRFGTQRYPGLSTMDEFNNSILTEEFLTCSFTGLMVSREAFISSGGLHKKFEPCEDFEFFNRFIDQGYILLIINEVLMKYRIHQSAITIKHPLLVRDRITYVKDCITKRRKGETEISFEAFLTAQQKLSLWTKLNRRRFQYSTIFFRNAGHAILSKKYLSFLWQVAASMILSPQYVVKKILNHSKK